LPPALQVQGWPQLWISISPVSGQGPTGLSERELAAYSISVVQKDERSFFGGPLPTDDGPAGFVQHEHPVAGFDEFSLALIKRFWLAERVMPNGHENAFTAQQEPMNIHTIPQAYAINTSTTGIAKGFPYIDKIYQDSMATR
jgi:hypothetical protein